MMKKIYLLFAACAITGAADAQIANAGFETWRVGSAGGYYPRPVRAPQGWYGADSLIIGMGQYLSHALSLGINDTVWQQQLFKDSTSVHGGTFSAMLVTKDQDTLGIFPGILSNAKSNITFVGTSLGPLTYSGGTAVTVTPNTVSAWVKYTPAATLDSGLLSVQALGNVGGVDSVIGTGSIKIATSATFTQVTANISYTVTGVAVDTLRITFASSAGTHNAVNSTLWVDDISMTGTSVGINSTVGNRADYYIYPNPATDVLHIGGPVNKNVSCLIYSADGKLVLSRNTTANSSISIAALPAGNYIYQVADEAGNVVDRNRLTVTR